MNSDLGAHVDPRSGQIVPVFQTVGPTISFGEIAFTISPPGGFGSAWQRVRVANYQPWPMQMVGIPGGSLGDPPQQIMPWQQHVYPYQASRGGISFSYLDTPPLFYDTFDYVTPPGGGFQGFVCVEFTDTAELFDGSYPVPLVGVTLNIVPA